MDKVLPFPQVRLNHPQPTTTAKVCLVQTKWTLISHCQFQFTNIGAKKTLFIIGLVVHVSIMCMDKMLWFAEVRPNHPQPTITAEVWLVQTKWTSISHCQLNLQILVWRKQKWTLTVIHSYWCEENIVIMLVETNFSLNGWSVALSLQNDDCTIHNSYNL